MPTIPSSKPPFQIRPDCVAPVETRLWLTSSNHSAPPKPTLDPRIATTVRPLTVPTGAMPEAKRFVHAPAVDASVKYALSYVVMTPPVEFRYCSSTTPCVSYAAVNFSAAAGITFLR